MKISSVNLKNQYVTYIESLTVESGAKAEHDEHAHHDELEIYHFIEGELFFSFEGERIPIQDGDVVIIASGSLHKTVIKSPCRYFRKRILVKNSFFLSMPEGASELQLRLLKKRIIKLEKSSVEQANLDTALHEIEEGIKKETPFDCFRAMTALAAFLIRAEQIGKEKKEERHFESKAKKIVEYIDKNLSTELDYKSIAKAFHISEKNLYKIFKNGTGFTLSKYIAERRIIKAKSLLGAGALPSEAARESGFADYSVFYRTFIREVGIPPLKYAKK